MAGIWDFLGGLMNKIPIQDRKERIKNKLEDLRKERIKLLHEPASVKTSKRITAIDRDIIDGEQRLRNLT
jgi:hypothetical protein